jgi:hypothetical protein
MKGRRERLIASSKRGVGIACACFLVLAIPGAATAGKGQDRDRGEKREQRGGDSGGQGSKGGKRESKQANAKGHSKSSSASSRSNRSSSRSSSKRSDRGSGGSRGSNRSNGSNGSNRSNGSKRRQAKVRRAIAKARPQARRGDSDEGARTLARAVGSSGDGDSGGNRRSARSSGNSNGNRNRGGNGNGNNGDGNGRGDGDGNGDSAPAAAVPRVAPRVAPTPPPSPSANGSGRFGSPSTLSSGLSSSAPGGPFSGVAPVAPIAPLTADRARGAGGSEAPVVRTRLAAAERSPIVRTVRQVVEVVPPIAWALIVLLAMLTLLGAGASWLLAARKRHAERQHEALLSDVGALQRALLPPAPEQIAGVATSVAYRPVSGPMAGGDFYDVFAIDDERLGVIIGDVARSGIEGIGLTATIRHTVRAYLEAGMSPRSALQVAAQVLEPQLGHTRATVTVALYDRGAGVLTYAAAGHPPPVILGATGFEPVAAAPSPPLGAGEDTGLRQTAVALPPGSRVCFYTDGVVEARLSGALYGYRRLSLSLTELGPRAGAPALLDRVTAESDATPDDMAAVVLQIAQHVRSAQDTEGVRRVEELELSREDLSGDLPAEFLAACGVPSGRIDGLVSDFRATAERIGGAVLRVRLGPGVPRAELALSRMDVLSPAARHE